MAFALTHERARDRFSTRNRDCARENANESTEISRDRTNLLSREERVMLRDGSFEGTGEWGVEVGQGSGIRGPRRRVQCADDSRCEEIHRTLRRIAKARGALDLDEATALREADAACIWRRYGYSSLLEYMEHELGYSPRVAHERLRVANAIVELPRMSEAMRAGELSYSAARELTRVATAKTEGEWLEAARELNLRELEDRVSGHQRGDRPSDRPDPSLQRKDMRLSAKPETYALVRQAQLILGKECGERLDDDAYLAATARMIVDGYRPAVATAVFDTRSEVAVVDGADAVDGVVVEHSSVDEESKAASGAKLLTDGAVEHPTAAGDDRASLYLRRALDGENRELVMCRTKAPYQIAVTVCRECKRGWQDGGGATVEISPAAVSRALCDAEEIGSIDGARPERTTQAIPPSVRRFVWRRDHGRCCVPGCRSSWNIDAHHLRARQHGGSNDPANVLLLCEGHHMALHAGTLLITGTMPDLVFTKRANSSFAIATRVVETAKALETLGFTRREAKDAAEQTRAHVGTAERPIEDWIRYALSKCPRGSS